MISSKNKSNTFQKKTENSNFPTQYHQIPQKLVKSSLFATTESKLVVCVFCYSRNANICFKVFFQWTPTLKHFFQKNEIRWQSAGDLRGGCWGPAGGLPGRSHFPSNTVVTCFSIFCWCKKNKSCILLFFSQKQLSDNCITK